MTNMKANIKDIRKATETLKLAPTHSGLVFKNLFGEELGGLYWSRMVRACRDIEAACDKLDALNDEMLHEAKRIQKEKSKKA